MELKSGILFDFSNKQYYVHDIMKHEGNDYLVAIEYSNPKVVEVFAYKFSGDVFMVKKIDDEEIIRDILFASLQKTVA